MSASIDIKIYQDFLRLKSQSAPPDTQSDGIIFLNELDNKPKFRESNNGKIYDLMTERYIGKNCQYEFNGDTNGLFYWIGTDFGNKTVVSSLSNYIEINPSSILPDYSYSNPNDLFYRNEATFTTDDIPYSFINVDFKARQQLQISGIYLKSPSVSDYGFIKTYTIGIIDPAYNELAHVISVIDDSRLIGINTELYIPLPDISFKTKQISIFQEGLNTNGTYHLALGQIELYGKFI